MVQDIFTATKVLALLIIIISGLAWLGLGNIRFVLFFLHFQFRTIVPIQLFAYYFFSNLQNSMRYTESSVSRLSLAFYSGLFSYAGWNYLNFITEELKDPNKNLPRAIYISMPLVTLVYVLANVAYFAVLSTSEILASDAVAVVRILKRNHQRFYNQPIFLYVQFFYSNNFQTFGNRMLGVMYWIIPVFVACSTFGSINGGIFTSSRLFFVGARNGHMPKSMALLNIYNFTPMPCLIFLV